MSKDALDDVALAGLDEGDDLHGGAAARAAEGIDPPDALDEGGPSAAGEARRGRGELIGRVECVGVRGGEGLGLGAEAPGLVGVDAQGAGEMLAGVGDVLGDLGDEIEGVGDLEIACDARPRKCPRPRKCMRGHIRGNIRGHFRG